VIDYRILGPVTARQDGWTAELTPQQQLLLAVLVMERGRAVPRQSLIRILWDEDDRLDDPPERPLKQVVAGLRARLRTAPGRQLADDLLPITGDTYRLRLNPAQADALRFRARLDEARRADGRAAISLLQAALQEWGDDAAGLYGGQPLTGLTGRWADSIRHELRQDYRDARCRCLQQDFDDHRYDEVATECRWLANEPGALQDEKFLALWMIAAYRSGHRSDAERVYVSAAAAVDAALGVPLPGAITRLAEVIRTEDPRLNGPGDQFALALIQKTPLVKMASSPTPAPEQRTPMTDSTPSVNFNNNDNTRVGMQAVKVDSPTTINMGSDAAETDQPGDVNTDPETADASQETAR
jgi:DNA-binding SARP family transcriptional activator